MHSAAVLNVAAWITWNGTARTTLIATPSARIYAGVRASCVYNVADPVTEQMVEQAEVVEGARAIGFTLGTPDCRCSAWSMTCWLTGRSSSSAGTPP